MKTVEKITLCFLAAIFLAAAGILAWYALRAYTAQSHMEALAARKAGETAKDLATKRGTIKGTYKDLWKENEDLIGWIEIKGTHIDYPVMQSKEAPEFYLTHDFKKEREAAGTPFMDASSDISLPTQNWLLYGHNMRSGIMFHDLLKYADKDFYEAHKTLRFDTIHPGQGHEYEIMAAFYTSVDAPSFRYFEYAGIVTKEDYEIYVENVKELSEYETNATAQYGEQLLTLSTCSYHVPGRNGRFVVVAKQAKNTVKEGYGYHGTTKDFYICAN